MSERRYRLKAEHLQILQETLEKRAPRWLQRIEDIKSGNFSREECWEIQGVLADELVETGFDDDEFEQINERGMLIEDIIDILPHLAGLWEQSSDTE